MLNKIWFWLLLIGILYGFGKGVYRAAHGRAAPPSAVAQSGLDQPPATQATDAGPLAQSHPLRDAGKDLSDAAFAAAKTSIEMCLTLIGMMALMLGLMNIAREAGMVDALARALRPVTRWLFPDVPADHPAQGAMLMNISANVLGLGNAATPFGLKAMRDLQTLNPTDDTATNAMATFMAINTSSVTLIPITTIGFRVAAGSASAAQPLAGIILATTVSTAVAIVAVRALSKLPRYRPPAPAAAVPDAEAERPPREGD